MNSHTSPKVSVVIGVYGRCDELEQCLDRLYRQTYSDFEILVCDDGSPEALAKGIRELCARDSRVRYLRRPQNGGPAAARNVGIAEAKGDIVAFTDSDTWPQAAWLENLLKPFADPKVVAVEGPVRTPTPQSSPMEEAPRNEGGSYLTANMAYRRDALRQIGGMDERLITFEDTDLAIAARKLGTIVFAPGAVVFHPWRRLGVKACLKQIRRFDWLLTLALRHGCLGWPDRPTRYPRIRVALAAAITLPLGRMRSAMRFLRTAPGDALSRMGISVLEAAIGLALAPRWLFHRYVTDRGRYVPS